VSERKVVLVTGFGPFADVPLNPSGVLAAEVNGREVAGHVIVGRVLPVEFRRGPDLAIAIATATRAVLVLGTGVAVSRTRPEIERFGRRVAGVDPGAFGPGPGPEVVAATLDPERSAEAFGAALSDDAGTYVCNAWLYRVARTLPVPVGFLHVPAQGYAAEALVAGLARLLA
jgi:pyroglutamyl-peptidase